jgi:hypothetical protein
MTTVAEVLFHPSVLHGIGLATICAMYAVVLLWLCWLLSALVSWLFDKIKQVWGRAF